MVSAKNRIQSAVIFSDLISELEYLIHMNQQLVAEKAALRQEFIQISYQIRDALGKAKELLLRVKELVRVKEIGNSPILNEAFGELANLISTWLDANEGKECSRSSISLISSNLCPACLSIQTAI